MQLAATKFLMKLGPLVLRAEFALEDAPEWERTSVTKSSNGALAHPTLVNGENVPH